MKRETNTQFTKNRVFAEACSLAGIPATSRQASKYRRGLGIATRYKMKAAAVAAQKRIREIFSKGS